MQIISSYLGAAAYVSYWRKDVHEVLVNSLGGLSLPRKSVVRLTDDLPDMTLDVYHGRKTTIQQQQIRLPKVKVTDLHIEFELGKDCSYYFVFFFDHFRGWLTSL